MLYNKTFYYQLYERTTKYCFYCTVLITTNHKSGNRQNLRNYHFLPTNCLHNYLHNYLTFFSYQLSTQLPTQLPNIFSLPTVYTTTYTTTCGYRIRKHCLLFTIGHLTCIFKEGNTKTVKCAKQEKNYYMQKADIERRRRGNKDILQLTDWAVFFLVFSYSSLLCVLSPDITFLSRTRTSGLGLGLHEGPG